MRTLSIKEELDALLHKAIGEKRGEFIPEERDGFGHFTTAVAMQLGKERKENPKNTAENLLQKIQAIAPEDLIEKIEVAGPGFINIWLTEAAMHVELARIAADKEFGMNNTGKGRKVIVEYSQPNIAKQMHTGHLRNTILGEALARITEANGYEVIRWNYLGDWGTQFGKLIAAYKLWGEEIDLSTEPIEKLEELYVRFHEAMKTDPSLEEKGREEFKKLEEGDADNRKLWELFKEASLKEIGEIYDILKIKFDTYIGEAAFEEKMKPLVKELLEKNIAEISEGAVIVKLDQFGLPPALIRKADGASLYLTRDIAALDFRAKEYKPDKLFYVVGNEQSLHFSQLIAVAGLLQIARGVELAHVKYGLLLGIEGKKMSTRKGTAISIRDLLSESIERAAKVVEEKNKDLSDAEKENVARVVGIGALKYFMLRENRMSDIVFDWEKMLDFKGDSGPYLQYTYARLMRVVSKGDLGKDLPTTNYQLLTSPFELSLIRKLAQFPHEVRRSSEEIMLNNLTKYLYELANLANRFYEDQHILTDENPERREARLSLALIAARTIAGGLKLLGIEVLESI